MTRRNFGLCALAGITRDSVAVTIRTDNGNVTTFKHGNGDERRAAAPGSVIKPLVLTALVELKLLQEDDTYLCSGRLHVSGRQLNCVHPPIATPMNVERAIAYSCNCAVAHWAERTNTNRLGDQMRSLGLNVNSGVRDVRLLALGEEGISISALQLAQAYRRSRFKDAVWAGMEGAVLYGTAQRAALPRLHVAGKTGSSGNAISGRVAWFAGLAPSRTPEVITVVMAAGGSGGADAAPIARELWLQHFGERA